MSTTTMPTVARVEANHARPVSQLMPLLVAIVLQGAAAVVSVLISGPMH